MNNSIENCFSHMHFELGNSTIFEEMEHETFTHQPGKESKVSQLFAKTEHIIRDWIDKIIQLGLNQKQSNEIFKLCGCLLEKFTEHNIELSTELNLSIGEVMNLSTEFVKEKLSSYDTTFKYKKKVAESQLFVPPVEKCLGTRIEMKRCKESGVAVPRVIQSKMQYVSILDSIRTLFLRDDFAKEFLNKEKDHRCTDGVYVDFCCGSRYKNTEFYKKHEYCLQIQIATDDFEVCNPLQSKAGIYKMCPIYFIIRNLPSKYLSRLDNIYLAAVCYAGDLKTEQCDFNSLWKFVYDDIKALETTGIDIFIPYIKSNVNVKGSISFLTSDNLGAHMSLGFAGGFNCAYNCRFCENSSEEYKCFVHEKQSQMRTKQSYELNLETIQTLSKIDYKQTLGIRTSCQLNELQYYHMLANKSVDIMHDLNEGVIPKLLKNIFEYFFAESLIAESELNSRVSNFNYGEKYQRNIPSSLSLKKKNLGQNATQSRCLFFHLPFLFADFRDDVRVKHVWVLVECLLRIMQVVYSAKINEEQLISLEEDVSIFLSNFREKFNSTLTIKMHLLLHYPNIIRQMGPIVHMSSMKFESKHKSLKALISTSSNHQNIPFSIAMKHQERLASKKNTYADQMKTGTQTIITKSDLLKYDLLTEFRGAKLCKTSWIEYNGIRFKENIFVITDQNLMEIREILLIDNIVHFICNVHEAQHFDTFLNSFRVHCNNRHSFKLVNLNSIKNKAYEKKQLRNGTYMLDETLDLKVFFKNTLTTNAQHL